MNDLFFEKLNFNTNGGAFLNIFFQVELMNHYNSFM